MHFNPEKVGESNNKQSRQWNACHHVWQYYLSGNLCICTCTYTACYWQYVVMFAVKFGILLMNFYANQDKQNHTRTNISPTW